MAILGIYPIQVGLVGVMPGLWSIRTNNTVGEVTAAGFLTDSYIGGFSFSEGDAAFVITSATPSGTDLNTGLYQINSSAGIWSLTSSSGPGEVTLPTIAGRIAVYTNVTGSLSQSVSPAINAGNIQAGLSGTAGTLASFPGTASRGALLLTAVANVGNTNVTISNASHSQASTYSIPDGGQTNSNFLISNTSGTQTIATGSLALTLGSVTATAGNLQAGSSGAAGVVRSFPSTAASGSLTLAAAVNSSGNFSTTISNATAVPQNQIISIPSAGNATGNFLITATPLISGNIPQASGVGGLMVDSGIAASSIVTPSDVVLLTPAANQTITIHSLIVGAGNLQAGSSGAAGSLISYPATAANGSLIISAINNAGGNFTTAISNAASVGQNQTITIPNSGAASANFILSAASALQSISSPMQFTGAGTNGDVQTTAGGNFLAGISGTAGEFQSFPGTAANGTLILKAANAGGAFNTTISNGTMGQSTVYTIPDVGAATGQFLAKTSGLVAGNLIEADGTSGVVVDAGVATSAIQLKAEVKAGTTADIGGAGAGPISVAVTGLTAASPVVATIASSSNTVAVAKCIGTVTGFDITFTGDPGAACVVNYVAYITAQ